MGRHHNTRRHVYSAEVESFGSPARDSSVTVGLNHMNGKEFSLPRPKSCLLIDMFCKRADAIAHKQ